MSDGDQAQMGKRHDNKEQGWQVRHWVKVTNRLALVVCFHSRLFAVETYHSLKLNPSSEGEHS